MTPLTDAELDAIRDRWTEYAGRDSFYRAREIQLDRDVGALLSEVRRLRAAIHKHRDQRGDDRCHLDDAELYAVLDDGKTADTTLPPKCEFLESCARFWEQRQNPEQAVGLPGMTIAQLQAEVDRLKEFEWMYKELCK